MYKNNVDVRVQVNGRPVREYVHEGVTFIEARNGTNYSIKIKNDNGFRVMAIVSVDGLDVITGKPAETSKSGYVINGYNSTEIRGYRVTDESAASFVFTNKETAYTTTVTGESKNSGVIGVRIYSEKVVTPPKALQPTYVIPNNWPVPTPNWPNVNPNPVWYGTGSPAIGISLGGNVTTSGVSASTGGGKLLRSTEDGLSANVDAINATYQASVNNLSNANINQDMACSAQSYYSSELPNMDTGTAWGKKLDDKVKTVEFRRGKMIAESILYYASREALLAVGVDLSDTPTISLKDKLPKAFGDSKKYCEPPKGWQG